MLLNVGGGFGGRKESGQLRFGCLDRPWKKPIALQYADKESLLKPNNHYKKEKSLSKQTSSNSDRVRNRHNERESHGYCNEEYSKRQKRW